MATADLDGIYPFDGAKFLTIWWRLGLSTLLAGQGMLLGLAVNLSEAGPGERLVLHFVVGATSFGVVFLLGWPLLLTAGQAVAERRVTIELLFLTAIVGALGASIQSTITGDGPVYFEVISILLVVYSFSKTMISQQRASAIEATRGWMNRLRMARLRDRNGDTRWVPAHSIRSGNMVEVQPGEWIPIDGVIQRGTAFVRDTPMTGEPFARVVRAGDPVLAGFAVEDASLLICATTAGSQRSIDELLSTVEHARGTASSVQQHADHLTDLFLPIVLSVATCTFVIWTALAGWQTALINGMSVLLVACPCALGLATPLAVWSTLSLLASRGLVIRQASLMEALASVDHAVFDKTGTLTNDGLYLLDVVTRSTGEDRARVLSWIASVESRSSHPVARALSGISEGDNGNAISNVEVVIQAGSGIVATFDDQQGVRHQIRIGRPEWISGFVASSSVERAEGAALESSLRSSEGSRIDVDIDGRLEASCILREHIRETAIDAIAKLGRENIKVSVLTGDSLQRAIDAGFDNVVGDLSPSDKAHVINDWQRRGARCLYVGDGINDAPALCTAHAAVALLSGTELARAAAPAVLCHGNLNTIPFAIKACRRAVRTLRSNLVWAAVYNTIGMGLAASGALHPVAAAVLMVGSSLLIAFRSLRLCDEEWQTPRQHFS